MRLLEYEAKQLLRESGLPVPSGTVIHQDISEEVRVTFPIVVKSQVPVGGRGKAGGVVIVSSLEELQATTEKIFELEIKGHRPRTLLLEPKLDIAHEFYLSLLINRETASIQLIAHDEGGVEIEGQQGFFQEDISEETIAERASQVAKLFREKNEALIHDIITSLYRCFMQNDGLLLEINPLIRTEAGEYICADAKMEVDDAAAFRHKEWDFEDTPSDANFVTLNENSEIATIANGAGLAMATVDAVAAYGMRPANFLDVGGGANKESVLEAFNRIMEYSHIKAIVINIFAGITRCDEVARAIISARQEISNLPPLFIRLAGTNFEAAAELLKPEKIPLQATLEECLAAAQKEVAA